MRNTILLGQGRQVIEHPWEPWAKHLDAASDHGKARLSFMSEAHHQVRYFVVREMPYIGKPIEPALIAEELRLPLAEVNTILDELEQNLFFLFRNQEGAVAWAYPVTVDETPHHLTFDTGEQLYAAGGEDAMAAPFVQGQLLNRYLSVEIRTACTQSGQPLHITLDSELNYQVNNEGAKPLVFEPHVNWQEFTDPSIINAYGRNSLFFWSEEHARKHRATTDYVDGVYLTLEQSAYVTRISQGALFAF